MSADIIDLAEARASRARCHQAEAAMAIVNGALFCGCLVLWAMILVALFSPAGSGLWRELP